MEKDLESSADIVAKARGDANLMGGFAKGLTVIEAFGSGRRMTIADIARICGLDRATARRCLLTLVSMGYATSDGRQFELTPRILRLGHSFLAAPLPRLIHPSLERLAADLSESCSAALLDGSEVVYIARVAQHRLMGLGLHAGSRLPAYCTAMGRVLLAALPAEQARRTLSASERPPITDKTITDLDALMSELGKIAKQGYAFIDGELEAGSRAVAVPLRNITGEIVAAVNVASPATRLTDERLQQVVLPALRDMQAYLAEILP